MRTRSLLHSPLALLVVSAGIVLDAKRRNVGALAFRDNVTGGLQTFQEGTVADQTRLLQIAVDGLGVYNQNPDPLIEQCSALITRQTVKVPQGPKQFKKAADGSSGLVTTTQKRLLDTPLLSYDLTDQFTVEALMDMPEDDLIQEVNSALQGDAELVNSIFWYTMFTKKTAGAVGTAYQASFYNGETDVPRYRQNQFAAAHYHYKGANTTTFTGAVFEEMIYDIQEHGYGLDPGSLEFVCHSSRQDEVEATVNTASTILQAGTPNRVRAIDQGFHGTSRVMIKGVWIRVDDYAPTDYVGLYALNEPILNRREHEKEMFRGLMIFREGGFSPEFPLAGTKFYRRIGMSARHLGAATFRQLVGSTTYTNPTFVQEAFN